MKNKIEYIIRKFSIEITYMLKRNTHRSKNKKKNKRKNDNNENGRFKKDKAQLTSTRQRPKDTFN